MSAAEKISVTLTPEMVASVRACVDRGEYASVSEVVRDALRAWDRQRAEDEARLAAIRERVGRSLDDPRPNLNQAQVDEELTAFFEAATSDDDAAA